MSATLKITVFPPFLLTYFAPKIKTLKGVFRQSQKCLNPSELPDRPPELWKIALATLTGAFWSLKMRTYPVPKCSKAFLASSYDQ